MAYRFNLLREDQMTLAQLRARRFVAVGRRRAAMQDAVRKINANLKEADKVIETVVVGRLAKA